MENEVPLQRRRRAIPLVQVSIAMLTTGCSTVGGLRRYFKGLEGEGPPCPRCATRRTWRSDRGGYRCRRCGQRFPDPDEVRVEVSAPPEP